MTAAQLHLDVYSLRGVCTGMDTSGMGATGFGLAMEGVGDVLNFPGAKLYGCYSATTSTLRVGV